MMVSENKWRHHGRVQAALLCIILIGASSSAAQSGQNRPVSVPQTPRQTLDPFLDPASGPVTLTKLLDLLRRVREDIETEGRILRAIEARGVDFQMTAETAQTIAAAGGAAKPEEVLERKAPPPPPLPPPPPAEKQEPAGALTVQCEPAECEITVRGGPPSLGTNNGTARISGLKLGEALVVILKPGYLDQNRTVVIKSGSDESVHVVLEPDANTQAQLGARLFKAMVEAAGREATQKDLAVFSATGSATDRKST